METDIIEIEEIGIFLRLLREVPDLSQDDAAEIIGVCGKTVHNIELRKTETSMDTIFQLFDLYGVSTAEIKNFYKRSAEMDYDMGMHHINERYRKMEEIQATLQSV